MKIKLLKVFCEKKYQYSLYIIDNDVGNMCESDTFAEDYTYST